jgi:hypothetical protein
MGCLITIFGRYRYRPASGSHYRYYIWFLESGRAAFTGFGDRPDQRSVLACFLAFDAGLGQLGMPWSLILAMALGV